MTSGGWWCNHDSPVFVVFVVLCEQPHNNNLFFICFQTISCLSPVFREINVRKLCVINITFLFNWTFTAAGMLYFCCGCCSSSCLPASRVRIYSSESVGQTRFIVAVSWILRKLSARTGTLFPTGVLRAPNPSSLITTVVLGFMSLEVGGCMEIKNVPTPCAAVVNFGGPLKYSNYFFLLSH